MQAKHKEVSSLMGVLVSGDSRSHQQMLNIIKDIDVLKIFMNEIKLEIEKI